MVDRGANDSGQSTGESGQPVRYTIAPGVSSLIAIKTAPGATCRIRQEHGQDPTHLVTLFADQDAMIHFHVRPSGKSEEVARFVVECESNGVITRFPLELRVSSQSTAQMPAPPSERPKPHRPGAQIRPPLSEDEMQRLSDEELHEGRYPPRPGPDEAPRAFNTWRRAVSVPATYVEPQVVSRPDVTHSFAQIQHGPATSNNWSGFELRGAGPYAWVTGKWNVPSVTGERNTTTYSAMWVGLDGDGTSDLVQAGTEQENVDFQFVFGHFTFSTYYAWTEFLPQQPTEQQIANFPVRPGDEMFVQVLVANAGGSPDLSGFFGQSWVENMTTSEFTIVYTPRGTTTVGGSEAVWIMERPTVSGSLPDLANYSSATMFDAYARRNRSLRHQGYVPYQGDTNLQITMMNGSDSLSMVAAVDTYSMRFSWQAFH